MRRERLDGTDHSGHTRRDTCLAAKMETDLRESIDRESGMRYPIAVHRMIDLWHGVVLVAKWSEVMRGPRTERPQRNT